MNNDPIIGEWRVVGDRGLEQALATYNGMNYVCVIQDTDKTPGIPVLFPPFIWLVRLEDDDRKRSWNLHSHYADSRQAARDACIEAIREYSGWLNGYNGETREIIEEVRTIEPIERVRRIT